MQKNCIKTLTKRVKMTMTQYSTVVTYTMKTSCAAYILRLYYAVLSIISTAYHLLFGSRAARLLLN